MPRSHYKVPHHASLNAISRVARHCKFARSQLSGLRREVHERRAGKATVQATGFALLSLDMSKAFDQVSHAYLAASMRHLNIDEDTIHLTLALHQSSYRINHHNIDGCIELRNGIRQGCVLSPLLWVCVTTYMLHCLGESTSHDWVRDEVTAFADDFISAFALHKVADAQTMAQRIQSLFTVLQAAGMQVNAEKSHFLIKTVGGPLHRWLTKRRFKQRGVTFYDMGVPFAPLPSASATTIDYLGVVMSYGPFEQQSQTKRLKAARANQAQLAKFLNGRKGLTLKQRLQLYRTCVLSAAVYGLPAVGVTAKSLRALHAFEIKLLRAIARSPRHLTHESNDDLYKRLDAKPVARTLKDLMQTREHALTSPARLFPGSVEELHWQRALIAQLREATALAQYTTLTPCSGEGVPCPECGLYFSSQRVVRIHCAKTHGRSLVPDSLTSKCPRNSLDFMQHCKDGMPVCKHCHQSFRKWRGFQDHILRHCPALQALPESAAGSPEIADGQNVPVSQFAAGDIAQPTSDNTQETRQPIFDSEQTRSELARDWVTGSFLLRLTELT